MYLNTKPLDRSRAGRHFYGTENVFWAGFGPVGNTGKKSAWADYEQLLRAVFSCFQGQKNIAKFFWKYPSVRTEKLHKISLTKFFFWNFFDPQNMKKPFSNRAKIVYDCVLLYWRHLLARLLYNDFDCNHFKSTFWYGKPKKVLMLKFLSDINCILLHWRKSCTLVISHIQIWVAANSFISHKKNHFCNFCFT